MCARYAALTRCHIDEPGAGPATAAHNFIKLCGPNYIVMNVFVRLCQACTLSLWMAWCYAWPVQPKRDLIFVGRGA